MFDSTVAFPHYNSTVPNARVSFAHRVLYSSAEAVLNKQTKELPSWFTIMYSILENSSTQECWQHLYIWSATQTLQPELDASSVCIYLTIHEYRRLKIGSMNPMKKWKTSLANLKWKLEISSQENRWGLEYSALKGTLCKSKFCKYPPAAKFHNLLRRLTPPISFSSSPLVTLKRNDGWPDINRRICAHGS